MQKVLKSTIYDVYQFVKGSWLLVGYRCTSCDKLLKSEVTLRNHVIKCKHINKKKETIFMPIHRITKNGKVYYRWGDQGKLYEKREDAEKQAQAAYASGYKEPKKDMNNK
jgi:phage FluMu protein Com